MVVIFWKIIYLLQGSCRERDYVCGIKIVLGAHCSVLVEIVKNLQPKNKLIILKNVIYKKYRKLWCLGIKC